MTSSIFKMAAAGICLSFLSGCASILGDSQYPVHVSSAPAGATFEITDKAGRVVHSGNTPSTVTLKSGRGYFKGETYTLKFHNPGYADKTVTLDSSVSGWYWGNILLGGVIGMLIVDPATGAMFKLPEGVSADMGKPVAQVSKDNGVTVMTLDKVPAELRSSLVQIQ
ncbi:MULTISPECIES: hypothetical protein [Pseudomonas]|uniref:hypothetical protein n=1 Tax=Pseudomonas TaxID=286 RepID=UPI0021AD973D|nr:MULTISPECIES: hypothetical protein [Pseudomonas]MDN3234528.1 hypothetical protein [Pseudomonas sp. WAC2]